MKYSVLAVPIFVWFSINTGPSKKMLVISIITGMSNK